MNQLGSSQMVLTGECPGGRAITLHDDEEQQVSASNTKRSASSRVPGRAREYRGEDGHQCSVAQSSGEQSESLHEVSHDIQFLVIHLPPLTAPSHHPFALPTLTYVFDRHPRCTL